MSNHLDDRRINHSTHTCMDVRGHKEDREGRKATTAAAVAGASHTKTAATRCPAEGGGMEDRS